MAGRVISGMFRKGRLSLSVAGGSNVTLSDAQAQNSILELTGALTADIAVIVPASSGDEYLVMNNTTSTGGPWALTVRTSAGTGPVVKQGKAAVVYCDGTNCLSGIDPNAINAQAAGRSALTFASDANKTLSTEEASNFFLDFTSGGTTLTATRNAVVPLTAGRMWLVRNASPGGQSVQVIGATGTGITIATTAVKLVLADGTNIISVAPVAS